MFNKRKKILIAVGLIIFPLIELFSQSYKYEIGGMGGASSYIGEANPGLYKNIGGTFGALFRYNHNFRYAVKANLAMAHVSGDTQQFENVFPDEKQYAFSRNVFDLGVQMEFHFFNYSEGFRYLETQSWTPYLSAGLGVSFAGGESNFFSVNIPFGVGIKYKIRPRWNVGMEISFRKLFQDNLDVTERNPSLSLDDPYNIKSAMYKNKDWYQLTFLFITYDFYSCGGFCK
ncbi:MAG: DUF6089 family protein [Candidatus Azobacteroides sp.]|nr:DUF6089 family protein [Candidatus Azobacteroides sp.]